MKDPVDTLSEPVKYAVDVFSAITVLATLVDMLPSIAALFTIIWTAIRIWETDTVRDLTGRQGGTRNAQQD